MKKVTVWHDTYMGVSYEINNFQLGSTDAWTFYLLINTKQIKENIWLKGKQLLNGKHTSYDYNGTIIGSLDWHCGCTYYEKNGGRYKWENKGVKVGCDYQHLWDENKHYTLETVVADAKKCIESLHRLTSVKSWCCYCGDYFAPNNAKDKRCKKCVDK